MDISTLIQTPEFKRFHGSMLDLAKRSTPHYTYVGFNFKGEKIVSAKFYYVFFKTIDMQKGFPVSGLEEMYLKFRDKQSEFHITTPFTPGGGFTFAIKFDTKGDCTQSFFHRVTSDNSRLVEQVAGLYPTFDLHSSDFQEGHGQYVLLKDGKVATNEYLYLNSTAKLREFSETIPFSEARCVEISSAQGTAGSQKFIAIGGSDLITEAFRNKIPAIIQQILKGTDVVLCCPAIVPHKDEYSVYALGKDLLQSFNVSPIAQIIQKYEHR